MRILTELVEGQLGWLLRPNHQEDDYGIDAYVDIKIDKGISGKSIAIQAKTGDSYFVTKNEFGWKFYGELKHLNYYLNHDIPVLIVIVDESIKKAFWAVCVAAEVERTPKNWSILIPYVQELNAASKSELSKFISPVIDYVSQLEHYWEENKLLKSLGRITFIAGFEDILQGNYEPLIDGLNRLSANKELLLTHKENIEIGIHGYDEDPRELYEIREARKWISEILQNVKGLSFFLVKDHLSQFLKLILFCNINVIDVSGSDGKQDRISDKKIECTPQDFKKVLDMLFSDLNEFCAVNKIPQALNNQITTNIVDCYTNGEWSRSKKTRLRYNPK